VFNDLMAVPGVVGVHDLHIWSLSVGTPSMSAHIEYDQSANPQDVLCRCLRLLADDYNIHHSTIQLEERGQRVICVPHYH
jgi:Co/Zn/Cd efflux system component